jgi:uncharacterized protein DUF4349
MRTRDRDDLSAEIARELAALDAALAGESVEEDLTPLREIALALRAERPVPAPETAQRLDAKVEERFRAPVPRKRPVIRARLVPVSLAGAASVFIAVTAIVSSGVFSTGGNDKGSPKPLERAEPSPSIPSTSRIPLSAGGDRTALGRKREVTRSAALVLSTPRDNIEDVADGVIRVTDRYHGFVMSSSVSSGEGQAAGATLDLRVPAGRLQPVLADLSKLGHVRSRTQSSDDITARFSSPRRRLADAVAERRALLRRLATAETPNEAASIRARLRLAERRIDRVRRALRRLDTRVGLAVVSVMVEPGKQDASGGWTIGDAARDALSVLGAVLGAVIIAVAVAVPLALLFLVAWGAWRVYLRHARERALDAGSPAVEQGTRR